MVMASTMIGASKQESMKNNLNARALTESVILIQLEIALIVC